MFFHGRGGNEDDVAPSLDVLDRERRLHAWAPRGPVPWDDRWSWSPPGQWPGCDPDTVALVTGWYEALPFPADRIVLAGWSQGGALAYGLGLAAGRPRPAAVLAFGAFLPSCAWKVDLTRPLPPLAIVHGTNDDAVPVGAARRARHLFERAGASVLYRETTSGHWLDTGALEEVGAVVTSLFPGS